ncbi:MAG: ATP-binding protein [Clostridia bacterium]|nr:ATP-binding protein [Clostridia bacterium]
MTRKECYNICLENKQSLLSRQIAARESALSRLEENNPRFAEIKRLMSTLGAKIAITAISGDRGKLKDMEKTLFELSKEKKEIIKSAGIEEIKYDCEKCRDTGYYGGKVCDCIKTAATKFYITELSKIAPVESCRFETFDLSFYPDTETEGGNPKKRMTAIFKLCKEYTIKFNPLSSESLLFTGNTGLGKTHLSLAIAYELLLKGYNVIYGSAYNMFAKMESEHFGEHSDKAYLEAVDCDLLIIDDLGGEFVSPYIQSLVYNIVNTRLLARKPTIINTNLSMAEINRIYTPRVASRLLGEYNAKRFLGNDIRQQKSAAR